MRASISYLTSTSATAAPLPTLRGAHRLDVLGYHRGERAVYLREHVGADLPVVHVVRTRGEHAGKMVPLRSWSDGEARDVAGPLRARLDALDLLALDALDPELWTLTTRVIQRRALKLPDGGRPIRKFAIQLTVEPLAASPESVRGRTVVTSYLRPRAHLERVYAIPGEPLALALIGYVGVPEDIGLDKQVAVVVGREIH